MPATADRFTSGGRSIAVDVFGPVGQGDVLHAG
jgi:ribosomal protein S28E/S33